MKNALVALGGGPSPVINSSLLGVCEAWAEGGEGKLFGARHGIEGVLQEQLCTLTGQPTGELAKLRHTPASGSIGTCRYKLGADAAEDYRRITDVLAAHDIGYFFYIGGNDSMDTAHKVATLAAQRGMELVVAGVPKTIDNDLGDEARTLIDHTPGYGSVARYWAMLTRDVEEENRGMCVSEPVAVLQAMGRSAGYVTAAARLADPGREYPLQLYFAETGHNLESLADNVNDCLRRHGRCIVIMTEGFDVGESHTEVDGFGHIEYGALGRTATQAAVSYLNSHHLAARGLATGQVPGVLQRSTSVFRSIVDVNEANLVARHAVELALNGVSGQMATMIRLPGPEYRIRYDQVPLEVMANSERRLPTEWIAPNGLDVTDAFLDYATPLIGGEMYPMPLHGGMQDFARLDQTLVDRRLPEYLPLNFRQEA